jgi:uncharacterized membrane protein YraQ (UPF0718 family)
MIDKLIEIALAVVGVVLLMAPYLLLGFAIAALLSVFFTPAWVTRHLGRPGLLQVIKASLIGVPLPLCSCGVLPLAFSLRKSGASKGATVSFLVSTPQTGADCLMLTYSLLGPVMAFFLLGVAFISGILSGWLTDWMCRNETEEVPIQEALHTCCCEGDGVQASSPVQERTGEDVRSPSRAFRNGFITLPRDMARPLLLGVLAAGVVTALVPQGYLAHYLSPGPLSYLLALSIGIPMYVCSASAVPIAAMLIHAWVSPGAAMVFLIAGPATNTAALFTLWNQIGRRATFAYLATICFVALLSGIVLDLLFTVVVPAVPHLHAHGASSLSGVPIWQWIASGVLLLLLLPGLFRRE